MIDRKRFFKILSCVRKDGKRVSESFEEDISKDVDYSYWYAEALLEKGIEVPEKILKSLYYCVGSYDLANRYLFLGKSVPKCLVDSISSNKEFSFRYALKLLKMGWEVPDCILKSFARDRYYSFRYLLGILDEGKREVPKLILDTVFRSIGASLGCSVVCGKTGKEVLESVLRGDVGFEEVVVKDSIIALQYAEFLVKRGKEIPRKVMEVLTKNPYIFIRHVEFLESIGLSISREYVDEFLKSKGGVTLKAEFLASRGLDVPECFLEDAEFCYAYAKESISRGRSVSEGILERVSRHSVYRIMLVICYVEFGLEVPDMLIWRIMEDVLDFCTLLNGLLDKNLSLPDKFLDCIFDKCGVSMERYIKAYLRKSYERGIEVPERHMKSIIDKVGRDIRAEENFLKS